MKPKLITKRDSAMEIVKSWRDGKFYILGEFSVDVQHRWNSMTDDEAVELVWNTFNFGCKNCNDYSVTELVKLVDGLYCRECVTQASAVFSK